MFYVYFVKNSLFWVFLNGIGNLCGENRVEPVRGKTRGTGGGKTRESSCIITSRGTGGWGNTRETCVRREFIASNPRNSAWGPRVAWITAQANKLLLLI